MDSERQFCIEETLKHRDNVKGFLDIFIRELTSRGLSHDASKLTDAEIEGFIEYTPKLKSCEFGSDEYKKFLDGLKPSLQHHYRENSHHPEHFPDSQEHFCCSCGHILSKEDLDIFEDYDCTCVHCNEVGVEIDRRYTLRGMNLIDILEMLCDWKAASMRHKTGDIRKSIEINKKRFGISEDIEQILLNTVEFLEKKVEDVND
jgi:hypothetical protein